MIQRKQTLFLLIFALFYILMFFMSLANVEFATGISTITPMGIKNFLGEYQSYSYTFAAFLSIMVLLPIIIIFLFKKRVVQLRLTTILMILSVAFMAYEWYYIADFFGSFSNGAEDVANLSTIKKSVSVPAFFPLPALLLAFMAFKGIARDEMIVRSYNRMR